MSDTYKVYEVGIVGCDLGRIGFENKEAAMKYLNILIEKGMSAFFHTYIVPEHTRYNPRYSYTDGIRI